MGASKRMKALSDSVDRDKLYPANDGLILVKETAKAKFDEKIEEIKSLLPNGYEIINTYDSTKYLTKELNKIYERTLYTIAILLFFIFIISSLIRVIFK